MESENVGEGTGKQQTFHARSSMNGAEKGVGTKGPAWPQQAGRGHGSGALPPREGRSLSPAPEVAEPAAEKMAPRPGPRPRIRLHSPVAWAAASGRGCAGRQMVAPPGLGAGPETWPGAALGPGSPAAAT